MAGVQLFPDLDHKGEPSNYGVGTFSVPTPRSFWVAYDTAVRFRTTTGQYGDKAHFYEGPHGDTSKYLPQGTLVMEVSPSKVKRADTMMVYWGPTVVETGRELGPGKHTYYDSHFPEHFLQAVRLGPDASVTFYEYGDFQGRSLTLSTEGYHNLRDYNFGGWTASLDLTLDAWETVGNAEIVITQVQDGEKSVVQKSVSNASPATITESVEIGQTISTEVEAHWNVGAELTTSAEVGGTVGVAEVKASVSATVKTEYGQTSKSGTSDEFKHTLQVEIPPYTTCEVSHEVDRGWCSFTTRQTIRNKRTGRTQEITGTGTAKMGLRSRTKATGGKVV